MNMPSIELETEIIKEIGKFGIAGLDEAGRGALAGPVVAAAVILPLSQPAALKTLGKVNDSKQVPAKVRQSLFTRITEQAMAFGIGVVSAQVIDEIGIMPATRRAMRQALAQLSPAADYLLIDGRIRLRTVNIRQQAIIRGDSKSLSIAAASILAKVTRDQLMVALDDQFPQFGFARHKGYGTPQHMAALAQHDPSPQHRLSFAPMRQTLLSS